MIWPLTITLTSLPPPPHSFQPHKPFYCPPDQAPVFSLSMANPFHLLSHFIQMPPCHKSILGQHYLIPSASFSDSILLFNSLYIELYIYFYFCLWPDSSKRMRTPWGQWLSVWYTTASHPPAPKIMNAWHSEGLHKDQLNGIIREFQLDKIILNLIWNYK